VTSELKIIQRLVDLGKYTYSFKAEELVAAVVTICDRYNIQRGSRVPIKTNGQIIAFQRDRVSVNTCAVKMLCVNYVNSKDMECLSHTLVHPGDHFRLHYLRKFKQDICALAKRVIFFNSTGILLLVKSFDNLATQGGGPFLNYMSLLVDTGMKFILVLLLL
jgi:hypothetical protein